MCAKCVCVCMEDVCVCKACVFLCVCMEDVCVCVLQLALLKQSFCCSLEWSKSAHSDGGRSWCMCVGVSV